MLLHQDSLQSLLGLVLGAVPVLLRPGPGVPGLHGDQIAPIPSFSCFFEGKKADSGSLLLPPRPFRLAWIRRQRSPTGRPITYWCSAFFWPVLLCATLHLPDQRTFNRSFILYTPLAMAVRQPVLHLNDGTQTSSAVSCLTMSKHWKGNYSWCKPPADILCLWHCKWCNLLLVNIPCCSVLFELSCV